MTRVVIAPDSFKGSLPAAAVAAHVAAGLRSARPDVEVQELAMADGGEGTVDAAVAAGFTRRRVTVSGPTGAPLAADYAVRGDTAVVEVAAASGLLRLPADRLEPLRASSFGTGQLVYDALEQGCRRLVLGLGGSASTDGGAGLLEALGARLLDDAGRDLPGGGAALVGLDRVDLAGLDPRLRALKVVLASDVDNPLLGAGGAAAVYAPQKGADAGDVLLLERALSRWAAVLTRADPRAAAARLAPGAGAAGGLGFAALAALGARRVAGVDLVADLVGLRPRLAGCALAVTGEGSLDAQTGRGKVPAGVARLAGDAGVPVVAVCGRLLLDDADVARLGLVAAYPLTDLEPDVAKCLSRPGPLLEELGRALAERHLPSRSEPGRTSR